ncbi:MAG: phage distal tail protein [Actinomycetes bacterium]
MTTWETLLVDGSDIASTARILQVWDGIHAVASERGDPVTVPGRDGVVDVDRAFDAFPVAIGLQLRGASLLTGFNDVHRDLKRLCKPGRKVTLSRRLSYTTGQETHTCSGRYLSGLEPTLMTPALGRVVVSFLNLDGLWYGPSTTIGTGTVSVLGDVRTRRMTVTLSGGAGPTTVTNTTNGWAFTLTGSTSTAVAVDVENMTATQGGTDVSSRLSWTKGLPLQLEAGSNTLTCSSGSASIAYQPAYL